MPFLKRLYAKGTMDPVVLNKILNQAVQGDPLALSFFEECVRTKTLTYEIAKGIVAQVVNLTEGVAFQALQSQGFPVWDGAQQARFDVLLKMAYDLPVQARDLYHLGGIDQFDMHYLVNKVIRVGDDQVLQYFSDCVISKSMTVEMATIILAETHSSAANSVLKAVQTVGAVALNSERKVRVSLLKGLAYEALYNRGAPYFISMNTLEPKNSSAIVEEYEGPISNRHFGCALQMFHNAGGSPLAMQHELHLISDLECSKEDLESKGFVTDAVVQYLMALDDQRQDAASLLVLARSKWSKLSDYERACNISDAYQLARQAQDLKMQKYCSEVSDFIKIAVDLGSCNIGDPIGESQSELCESMAVPLLSVSESPSSDLLEESFVESKERRYSTAGVVRTSQALGDRCRLLEDSGCIASSPVSF